MHITTRVLDVLRFLRRYKFADRALIQRVFFLTDKDGSVTRDFLRKLVAAGLAKRARAEVADPALTSTAPVYIPTEAGCCLLATHTGDMTLLLDCQPNTRAWVNYRHWVCLSNLFVTIDQALKGQTYVAMPRFYFEHDILNPDADTPKDKFKLYTEISSATDTRKLVCVPDAAGEIVVGSHRRPYYFEYERGTDTPNRVAALKAPGVAGLFESKKFQRHFPEATDFRVIAVCPNAGWRDALRKAMTGKKGCELWLFVAEPDITPTTFLHEPIFYDCAGEVKPLVKPAPGGATAPDQATVLAAGRAE